VYFRHRGVLDTTLCEVCKWLATVLWFSPGTPVSSINKTDRHDITEILLKVALNTINHNQPPFSTMFSAISWMSVEVPLIKQGTAKQVLK
jgi:hypothetical protein